VAALLEQGGDDGEVAAGLLDEAGAAHLGIQGLEGGDPGVEGVDHGVGHLVTAQG
jgi:hypothetical protein